MTISDQRSSTFDLRSPDIATAVVSRDGKLLLIGRRGRTTEWAFPSAPRRGGESGRACLKRALQEELGIEVAVRPHDWKLGSVRFHRCSILQGQLSPSDGWKVRWVAPQALGRLCPAPAGSEIAASIARARFVDPHAKG